MAISVMLNRSGLTHWLETHFQTGQFKLFQCSFKNHSARFLNKPIIFLSYSIARKVDWNLMCENQRIEEYQLTSHAKYIKWNWIYMAFLEYWWKFCNRERRRKKKYATTRKDLRKNGILAIENDCVNRADDSVYMDTRYYFVFFFLLYNTLSNIHHLAWKFNNIRLPFFAHQTKCKLWWTNHMKSVLISDQIGKLYTSTLDHRVSISFEITMRLLYYARQLEQTIIWLRLD